PAMVRLAGTGSMSDHGSWLARGAQGRRRPAPAMRILSWNLWWRYGPWERRREAIAATLAEVDPDLCGLQEVWEAQGENQAADCAYPPVVTGDLNAEPGSDELRLLGGLLTAPAAPGLVLIDAWRHADPGDPGFTWDRGNGYQASSIVPDSRIDYILVGPHR